MHGAQPGYAAWGGEGRWRWAVEDPDGSQHNKHGRVVRLRRDAAVVGQRSGGIRSGCGKS